MKKILLIFIIAISHLTVQSQAGANCCNASYNKQLQNLISEKISKNYIIASKSEEIAKAIQANNYDTITDPTRLAANITRDLRQVSKDRHFEIAYLPQYDSKASKNPLPVDDNFGFEKLEIKEGNIGYLKFNYFAEPDSVKGIVEAAVEFLSRTDGIIIDCRENFGGKKALVELLVSYFIPNPKTPLYDVFTRTTEIYHGYSQQVNNKKILGKPIYILTSRQTFSSAELFSELMRNFKGAKIIGEQTAGGGHTVDLVELTKPFYINLPVGDVKFKNGLGWEGTGISPDKKINPSIALETAYYELLEALPANKKTYKTNWVLSGLSAIIKPPTLSEENLKKFEGAYGQRSIFLKDKKLYYKARNDLPEAELVPIDGTHFLFNEVDSFRIEFILDEKNNVTGLKGYFKNNTSNFSRKD